MTIRMHMRRTLTMVSLGAMITTTCGVAAAAEPSITNGDYNTFVRFSLEGPQQRHAQRFHFTTGKEGALQFAIGCRESTNLSVHLDNADGSVRLERDATGHPKDYFFHASSADTIRFEYKVTPENLKSVRVWELEIASPDTQPECTLDLNHNGRVSSFRWDGVSDPVLSRAPGPEDTDRWSEVPFVVWTGPRKEDAVQ